MAGLGWLERRYRMIRADRPVVDGVVWTQKVAELVNAVVSKAAKKTQAWTVGQVHRGGRRGDPAAARLRR